MQKKLQVFISSTYTDLKEERQRAVEGVLKAGHIPAGMELFSSGDKSQLEIIKKWIKNSDVYMLILGGRYGSIDLESGLSYTELEYRYAVELNKPLFAIVLSKKMIEHKAKNEGLDVWENTEKYQHFKDTVLSKLCAITENQDQIELKVLQSLKNIEEEYPDLDGWIKGDDVKKLEPLLKEIESLRIERNDYKKKLEETVGEYNKQNQEKKDLNLSYDEIKVKLLECKIYIDNTTVYNLVPFSKYGNTSIDALNMFIHNVEWLKSGIKQSAIDDTNSEDIFDEFISLLSSIKLVNRGLEGADFIYKITTEGEEFIRKLKEEGLV